MAYLICDGNAIRSMTCNTYITMLGKLEDLYFLLHLGPPDPVVGCKMTNKTYNSLYVMCKAGYNGGVPQTFVIEVHEQRYYDDFVKKYRVNTMSDEFQSSSGSSDGTPYNGYAGVYSGTTPLGGMTPLPPSPITRLEMLHEPRFALENLPPGTPFTLVIYAKNEKVVKRYDNSNPLFRTKIVVVMCNDNLLMYFFALKLL